MRTILIAAVAALSLAACTTQQAASVQNAETKAVAAIQAACVKDGQLQPVLIPLAGLTVPALAVSGQAPAAGVAQGAIALDETVLHPAIQAACAQIGATPAPVQPTAAAPAGK